MARTRVTWTYKEIWGGIRQPIGYGVVGDRPRGGRGVVAWGHADSVIRFDSTTTKGLLCPLKPEAGRMGDGRFFVQITEGVLYRIKRGVGTGVALSPRGGVYTHRSGADVRWPSRPAGRASPQRR